jgi:hypothetical protein
MLNNAGKKITFWSNVLLYVGIAVSVIIGFILIWNGAQTNTFNYAYYRSGYVMNSGMMGGGRTVILGFLVIAFGSLLSWLWALLLRAFGDLVTDTRAIREQLECACFEVESIQEEEAKPAAPEAPAAAQAEAPAEAPAKPKTRKPAKPKAEAAAGEPEAK